jgi:hypothetical protein
MHVAGVDLPRAPTHDLDERSRRMSISPSSVACSGEELLGDDPLLE